MQIRILMEAQQPHEDFDDLMFDMTYNNNK